MHAYPKRLLQGKNAPWYFISRLTSNRKYDNVQMGDRLLAIWLGQSFYHFTTCDTQKNQANMISNIDYPADIEGVWTYIHYSYSKQTQTANSFIRYSQSDIQSSSFQAQHPDIDYLKFIFGGNDQNRYPGFNGFISKIMITISKDNFLSTKEEFITFVSKLEQPKVGLTDLITYQLIENETQRQDSDESLVKTLNDNNQRFPQEYAMSGWFKWIGPQRTPWHNIFRVQIQTPSTDIYLGDRTLCMWLGSIEGGVLHFPTYTYDNTNSKGNPNYYKNIKHNQRHLEWFYVYFGYQKSSKQAYVQVAWPKDTQDILYQNINHYLTPSFYIFVGKDNFYPGLSGKLAYVYFNLGNGSFKMKNEITDIVESYLKGSVVIKPQISNTQKKEQEQSTQEIKQVNQDIKAVNQETKQINQETRQTNQEEKQTTQETKQVNQEIKQNNSETQQVNQETKQVISETKQINQETQQINQEVKQTNQETKQINQETKQANQEMKQTTQETKQVNQDIKQSNSDTKEVSQETKQINQQTKQTTQENKQVNQEVKQETKSVNQETKQVNQETQQTNQETKQTTQEVKQTNQESKQVNQEVKQTTQETNEYSKQVNEQLKQSNEQTKQVTQEIKQEDQKQQTTIPFDHDTIKEGYSDTPGLKPGKIDQSEQQECSEQTNDKDTPLDKPIEKKPVTRTVQQQEQTSEEAQAIIIDSKEVKVDQSLSSSQQNQELTKKVDQQIESSQKTTQETQQVTSKTNETTSQTNSITQQTNDASSITNTQTQQTNETIQQNNKTIQETNETNSQSNKTIQETSETTQQNNKTIQETNETTQSNNKTVQQTNETVQQVNQTVQQTNETVQQVNKTQQETSQTTQQTTQQNTQQTTQQNTQQTTQQNTQQTTQQTTQQNTQSVNQSTQQSNSQTTESKSTQTTQEINNSSQQIDKITQETNEQQQEQHDFKIIDHKNEETIDQQTIDMPTQEDDYCVQDQDDEQEDVKEIKIIPGQTYENQISNDKEGKNPIVDQGITVANNYSKIILLLIFRNSKYLIICRKLKSHFRKIIHLSVSRIWVWFLDEILNIVPQRINQRKGCSLVLLKRMKINSIQLNSW